MKSTPVLVTLAVLTGTDNDFQVWSDFTVLVLIKCSDVTGGLFSFLMLCECEQRQNWGEFLEYINILLKREKDIVKNIKYVIYRI